MEEEARELLDSPLMRPYMRLALAVASGEKIRPALEEIAALPLEQRYVWRVASALKWAFADLDMMSVGADRRTLSPEHDQKLSDLLRVRPVQFCLYLSALFGEKQMDAIMSSAIHEAHAVFSKRDRRTGPTGPQENDC